MHAAAPTPLAWGGLHGEHEPCPAPEYVFAGQYTHCVEPTLGATFPGGHASHTRVPVPAENRPAGHARHDEDPTPSAKVPTGQGTHEVVTPLTDLTLW